jgi:hypothetical protein
VGLWPAGYAHRKITERCQVSAVRWNGLSPTRLVDGLSSESMEEPTRLILNAPRLGELPAVAVAEVKAEPHETDRSRPQSSAAPLPPPKPHSAPCVSMSRSRHGNARRGATPTGPAPPQFRSPPPLNRSPAPSPRCAAGRSRD